MQDDNKVTKLRKHSKEADIAGTVFMFVALACILAVLFTAAVRACIWIISL